MAFVTCLANVIGKAERENETAVPRRRAPPRSSHSSPKLKLRTCRDAVSCAQGMICTVSDSQVAILLSAQLDHDPVEVEM